jgi:energy-coupling factor transporter ATP-binding protein EcfA2
MDNTALPNWDNDEVDKEIQSKLDQLVDWRSLEENHFIHQVEKARLGSNIGVENGSLNLSKYTYGTHKGRYYLIGADSGVGKTTLADFMYVIKAYESAKQLGRKVYFFYYSFEISLEEKKARWASYYIFQLYGILIPADYIQGRMPGLMVSDLHMTYIRRAYLYIEEILKHMIVVEDPVHPTKIFHDLIDHHYEKIGKVLRHTAHDPKKKGAMKGWIPNKGEEDSMTFIIIDHVALLASEQGFDTKQTIDLMSKYFVTLRNMFGLTEIVIQQFNTDITSTYRMNKKGEPVVKPQRIDFGDSRYTFRDANVVLGIIKPMIYDIPDYCGYDITKLREYFIAVYLMKNRHGKSQRMLPMLLEGVSGFAEDLPVTPNIDIVMNPYFEKVIKLEKLCQWYSQPGQ